MSENETPAQWLERRHDEEAARGGPASERSDTDQANARTAQAEAAAYEREMRRQDARIRELDEAIYGRRGAGDGNEYAAAGQSEPDPISIEAVPQPCRLECPGGWLEFTIVPVLDSRVLMTGTSPVPPSRSRFLPALTARSRSSGTIRRRRRE